MDKAKRREAVEAYMFLSPWIIGFIVFLIVPIGMSIYAAFTRWILIDPPPRWTGLENFRYMFTADRYFLWSLGVTVRYMLLTVIPFLVVGLILALLLNQKIKGMNLFRTIFYLPSVISGVAVAILWVSLLDYNLGAVNTILRDLGMQNPPNWLNSAKWALPSVALMSLWGIGGGAIIYLAGLQNIPAHLYEAADIDGATDWQKFWKITLPMVSPTMFFTLITGIIGAFQVFTPAYVISGGARWGTTKALRFYVFHVYIAGFNEGRLGYASALAWVLTIISIVAVIIVYNTSDRYVYYAE